MANSTMSNHVPVFPNVSDKIAEITTNGATYTPTRDCYMYFFGYGTNTEYCGVSIDNVEVLGSANYGTTWNINSAWLPVKAGSTVKFSKTSGGIGACRFYSLY